MDNEIIEVAMWTDAQGRNSGGKPVEINGRKYWVNLYDNRDNKRSDKAPDFKVILKPALERGNVQGQSRGNGQSEDVPF